MNEYLRNLPWESILPWVWTVILIPILGYIKQYIDQAINLKNTEKYTSMLYSAVDNVVKDIQVTIVDDIKGTDKWTDEKIAEIKQIALTKVIEALSTDGYTILKEANSDFDSWVDSIIQAKLYELKQANKMIDKQ